MKKTTAIFGVLITGSMIFVSCTKNLKDDIRELREKVGEIENILGSNEPIKATTTFIDDNDSTRKVTGTYSFKAGNASTQYIRPNGDGTYEIYIERFSDVEWYEGAWVEFNYNPATKAITSKRGGHYWDDMDPYWDYVYYSESYNPAPVITITINSIDITTGDISLKFSANAGANYSGSVPNPGDPVSTEFSFAGKLKVFSSN